MNKLDVVITTYNRPQKVSMLINQLLVLAHQHKLGLIVVVDSSINLLPPTAFGNSSNLKIIHSRHPNQPYQRWLGMSACVNEYILFLDDDMEVILETFPEDISMLMKSGYAGINLKFRNENIFLANQERSVIGKTGMWEKIRNLSGYQSVPDNKMGFNGVVGRRVDKKPIEFVGGGAFVAKRELLFLGLSTTLFDLFEKKLGGGEDRIIGYALSCTGTLWAHSEIYFNHNDQNNSVYTTDEYRFSNRVAYSRLFLSFEYSRLNGTSKFSAFIRYQWFSVGRILGMLINFLIRPTKVKFQKITGYIVGFLTATVQLMPIYLSNSEDNSRNYWSRELSSDLSTLQ